MKIAYIISKFPKISETFILYEMMKLLEKNVQLSIFPLVMVKTSIKHKEVNILMDRVNYIDVFSIETLNAQLYWMLNKPTIYGKLWIEILRRNIKSPKFLSRSILVMPLACVYARRITSSNVQRIHAHWATHTALTAYIIKTLTGIPYSFTAHAHDIYVTNTMLKQKIDEADYVVTISEFNKKCLNKLFGDSIKNKIKIIRCGIDTKEFDTVKQIVKHKIPLITCIGSLEEYKGHYYLIKACKILKDKNMKFRCFLIGQGVLRNQIAEMISEYGLTDSVYLLGIRPQHMVKKVLSLSSIYVQPSVIIKSGKMEGIPVAIMEALAMQLPVVATDISGISELVENNHTGILVPQKDEVALANGISTLLNNDGLAKKFGIEGRKKVLDEYNIEHNVDRLFNEVICK